MRSYQVLYFDLYIQIVILQNISDNIDNAKLQEMFQKFGNILSCKIVTSEEGKSKGYGFVQFGSEESADAAIEKLNGTMAGDKQMYEHFHTHAII